MIAAAIASNVQKLVFASSAGIVFDGSNHPEKAMNAYNESKAKAEEIVLAANGKVGLLTVALRPAGIYGWVPYR